MIEGVSILLGDEHHRLPKPFRHHHIIKMLSDENYPIPIVGEQGFYDEAGKFLNRVNAATNAIECGQITHLKWGKKLYSEDVW